MSIEKSETQKAKVKEQIAEDDVKIIEPKVKRKAGLPALSENQKEGEEG